MARRFYQLPSLTGLNTFDACARHGSFSEAAVELGVTLGAVSRQIKALETELNCALFRRHYRGVELTGEGIDLFQTLSGSFQQIGRLCQEIRARGHGNDVTIAANTAFASLWLMPRLSGFWQRHPDVNLNHAISDNPEDTGYATADLRIRYGNGRWRNERAVKLLDDRIYPVCGRDFARRHDLSHPDKLRGLPLLRLDSVDPAWTGWNAWMRRWGGSMAQANFRRFSNYVVALQAAEENQGIALGWHALVDPLIRRGKLVRVEGMDLPAPGSYYLNWDPNRALPESARLLRDWLLEVAGRAANSSDGGAGPTAGS